MPPAGFKLSKGIDKPRPHERVKSRALLFGEARVLSVRLRMRQVDLLMGHIKISAHDHRQSPLQLFQVF